MSKEAMRSFAREMKDAAGTFIAGQSRYTLADPHPALSRHMGAARTNQHALMAMIRHMCYHIGCCDAFLRDRTGRGVY